MKLIVAVLRKEDEADTIAELNKKGFFVTELATTGGFLKEKNTTLLIGTDDHKLDAVLAILKQEAGLLSRQEIYLHLENLISFLQ